MSDVEPRADQDWIVPAVLVAAIVVLAIIVLVVLAGQASESEDASVAGQLERWSTCLRAEGANVPLVETLRSGGFRITVDGSLVEEGIDEAALRPALDECQDQAPEEVRRIMTFVDGASDLPSGAFEMLEGFDLFDLLDGLEELEEFDGFDGFGLFGEPDRLRRRNAEQELEKLDLRDICEAIERGDLDTSDLPRRLVRRCA